MDLFTSYLDEIERRKEEGLNPLPIDNGDLVEELVLRIKDAEDKHREMSLNFFIFNCWNNKCRGGKSQFS